MIWSFNPLGGRAVPALAAALIAALFPLSAPASKTAAAPSRSGVDLSARDTSVRPGDDFFGYALGGWYARTAIPADQSVIGVDQEVSARVQDQLRDIIQADAKVAHSPTDARIGGLYRSFMDEDRIEALDAQPLRPLLAAIASADTREAFIQAMARTYAGFGGSLFSLQAAPDAKRPVNVWVLGQDGLGLPDRDYYLKPDLRTQKAAYQAYAARTLAMVGYPEAETAAARLVAFETRIAEVSWDEAAMRDLDRAYNPMTLAALQASVPGIDWPAFFAAAGITHPNTVVVSQPSAIRDIAAVFAETPLETLRAWETFRIVDNAAPYLSRRFVDSRFALRGVVLSGSTTQRPRWKRAVALVNAALAQALGQAYVARHFDPRAKAEMRTMVGELKAAMRARLRAASWMSQPTRREALAKLERMKVFVGYPDRWRDYSGLRIDPADLLGNVARSTSVDWAYQRSMADKPVDPMEWGPFAWGVTPQTVDAFNIASENKIIFPAAILQPPYFDPRADPAVNYGAIGGVVGHEITHGFDDQGRKIDASGRLRDWWARTDAARYQAEAEKLVRQYDAYEPLPGLHLNGRQILGENIADLGGLLLALDAYHASLRGKPAPVIDGLTGDQRVFLGWASRWRRKTRDEALRSQIATDVHAPAALRVTGPVRNIDAWYGAFGVGEGERLYLKPGDRARVW